MTEKYSILKGLYSNLMHTKYPFAKSVMRILDKSTKRRKMDCIPIKLLVSLENQRINPKHAFPN